MKIFMKHQKPLRWEILRREGISSLLRDFLKHRGEVNGCVPFRNGWVIWTILLVCWGCSAVEIIKESSQPTRPLWISQFPKSDADLFFIGANSGAHTLEDGENGARKDALSKVAEYLGIDIKAELDMIMTEHDQSLKEHLKAKTEAFIKEAGIVDTYYEKTTRVEKNYKMEHYNVYLLLKYPKTEAQKELLRRETEPLQKAQAAYKVYQSGKTQIQQGHYQQALQFFREASDILKQLPNVVSLDQEIASTKELSTLLKSEEQSAIQHLRRVVILLQEQTSEKEQGSSAFGTSLQQVLTKHQFSFVEHSIRQSASDQGFDAYIGQEGEDLKALQTQGIQYLIVGQAHATLSSTSLNNHFYKAQGMIKVFSTQTGEALLTLPVNGKGYHRDHTHASLNALSEAGKAVGELLVNELLSKGLI